MFAAGASAPGAFALEPSARSAASEEVFWDKLLAENPELRAAAKKLAANQALFEEAALALPFEFSLSALSELWRAGCVSGSLSPLWNGILCGWIMMQRIILLTFLKRHIILK